MTKQVQSSLVRAIGGPLPSEVDAVLKMIEAGLVQEDTMESDFTRKLRAIRNPPKLLRFKRIVDKSIHELALKEQNLARGWSIPFDLESRAELLNIVRRDLAVWRERRRLFNSPNRRGAPVTMEKFHRWGALCVKALVQMGIRTQTEAAGIVVKRLNTRIRHRNLTAAALLQYMREQRRQRRPYEEVVRTVLQQTNEMDRLTTGKQTEDVLKSRRNTRTI